MNFATQRFTESNPSCALPQYEFWYEPNFIHIDFGEPIRVCQYFNSNDGMTYQYSYTYGYDDDDSDAFPILHGPAPKSWVDASDLGMYFPYV